MSTYEKLVLFDIDGTIMNTDGAGDASFLRALSAVFDRSFSTEGFSANGKTDTQIAYELAERSGIPRAETEARLGEIREHYLAGLKTELAGIEPTVFPGVLDLVAAVSDSSGCLTGLLTGNFEPGAWMKLDRIGLKAPFQMGAFGDGAASRDVLPGRAVERAKELTNRIFTEKEIVIIGDTPNDVACGRHLNVRSIAVATGRYDEAALAEAKPDALFGNLSDTAAVMKAIAS